MEVDFCNSEQSLLVCPNTTKSKVNQRTTDTACLLTPTTCASENEKYRDGPWDRPLAELPPDYQITEQIAISLEQAVASEFYHRNRLRQSSRMPFLRTTTANLHDGNNSSHIPSPIASQPPKSHQGISLSPMRVSHKR